MIIGIDGNEANVKDKVGVNRYAFEILWALHKLQDSKNSKNSYIIYLSQSPRSDMPKPSKYWKYKVIFGNKLWILTKLTPHLLRNKENIELLFSPSHYTVPFSKVPRICSIMDLGYLKYTEQFNKTTFWQLKYWSAISISVSKYVIAISNATKEDIVRHYPRALKKVVVTHLAYEDERFNDKIQNNDVRRIKSKHSIVDDYVLYLGTLKPSKNIEGLIDAFSTVNEHFPKVKLVIAGKKGWMYKKIFEVVKEKGLEKNIIFTGFIEEEDKPSLVKGAKIFAAPSFWEGFGIQILEAMACGTVIVASNLASIPEIVGSDGILIEPTSPKSIAGGLIKVLEMNQKEYNDLRDRAKVRAKSFSWENTALKTLDIFEKTLKK